MKIIVPASGVGKRFIDAGYKDTKPLIDVTPDKKIIDYVIDIFDKENDEFFFITSETTFNDIQEYIETLNINFKHLLSTGPKLGPVGAVNDVSKELSEYISDDDQVIVSYCDYGMEWDYQAFLNYVNESGVDGAIPCYVGEHPHLEHIENVYAACKKYDNSDRVYEVKEKYHSKDRNNESWSAGLYYFKSFSLMNYAFTEIVKDQNTLNDEYYVSLAYNYIVNDYVVTSYDYITKFYQFGTPSDFEYAKEKINISNDLLNNECSTDNIVILSAGQRERFLNLNYSQPKPFMPLNDTDIITNITDSFKNVQSNVVYVGSQEHEIYWNGYNVNLITPNKIGAAFSYKEGASNIKGEALIVPCDLIAKHVTDKFLELREDANMIIFTADPTEFAIHNKNSFAWVGGEDNVVTDISIKERAQDNHMVLIGSFWVKHNEELLECIDEIFENKFTVKGEYYLDNAFKHALQKGLKIKYIKLDNYLSFGTPSEYNENKYWFNGV